MARFTQTRLARKRNKRSEDDEAVQPLPLQVPAQRREPDLSAEHIVGEIDELLEELR